MIGSKQSFSFPETNYWNIVLHLIMFCLPLECWSNNFQIETLKSLHILRMWSVRIKQNWAEQPKKDDTPGCGNIKPNSMTGIKQGFSSKVAVEIYCKTEPMIGIKQGFSSKVAVEIYCKTELDDWHQARFLFQGFKQIIARQNNKIVLHLLVLCLSVLK